MDTDHFAVRHCLLDCCELEAPWIGSPLQGSAAGSVWMPCVVMAQGSRVMSAQPLFVAQSAGFWEPCCSSHRSADRLQRGHQLLMCAVLAAMYRCTGGSSNRPVLSSDRVCSSAGQRPADGTVPHPRQGNACDTGKSRTLSSGLGQLGLQGVGGENASVWTLRWCQEYASQLHTLTPS